MGSTLFQNTPTWDRITRLAEEDNGIDFDTAIQAANDSSARTPRGDETLRNDSYYSDLIFVLTHLRVAPGRAHVLWLRMCAHRQTLTSALGRDPGIVVATADLLVNLDQRIQRPVLIDESRLRGVVAAATHDGLTGLQEHATGMRALERELERARRHSLSVSVLMIDIDRFKAFNDAHGHVTGDDALVAVAQAILGGVRGMDHVVRYGGEEFCVILPDVDGAEATSAAERVRAAVAASSPVTISVGVATSVGGRTDGRDLVRHADEALYAAKAAGRNCVKP